ncbi:MAG: hypothetical protein GVY28_13525 [Alphaproteobacteria bacterium]|jgi:protein involved in polysaccharide export with SLBB domain|nr:hypothetical protein [Alphaproteobacteria bacterium]
MKDALRRIVLTSAALALVALVPPAAAQEADTEAPAAADEQAIEDGVVASAAPLRSGDEVRIDFIEVPTTPDAPYTVTAGDQLRIVIAGSAEVISDTTRVMPDGAIAVDPVGMMAARGATVAELAERLEAAFAGIGMRQPRVTVSVVEPNGELRTFLESLDRGFQSRGVEVRVFRDVPLQLPAVGEIDVPDTLADLREGVARAYRERFGGSVETTVNFSDRSPPVVYVTGDVREPGAYPWSRDLTPLRAIAQAGGFTITANVAQVSVIAGDGGDDGAYTLDFSGIYAGEGGPLAEPLRVNDVIVVPATPTFR